MRAPRCLPAARPGRVFLRHGARAHCCLATPTREAQVRGELSQPQPTQSAEPSSTSRSTSAKSSSSSGDAVKEWLRRKERAKKVRAGVCAWVCGWVCVCAHAANFSCAQRAFQLTDGAVARPLLTGGGARHERSHQGGEPPPQGNASISAQVSDTPMPHLQRRLPVARGMQPPRRAWLFRPRASFPTLLLCSPPYQRDKRALLASRRVYRPLTRTAQPHCAPAAAGPWRRRAPEERHECHLAFALVTRARHPPHVAHL